MSDKYIKTINESYDFAPISTSFITEQKFT